MYNEPLAKISEPSKRDSQVGEQLSLQEKLISELAVEIDMLSEALASVTRIIDGVPTSQDEKEMPIVPLATTLRSNNNYLVRNINRLQNIRNLLEL